MSISREQILTNGRWAGDVLRYHTWPMLRPQTIGSHTWQILRIYVTIFGAPQPDVTVYVIWHDAGELVLGDLPFPVKAQSPTLKKLCDGIENLAVVKMAGEVPRLSKLEKLRVKICDLAEMYETGIAEFQMGNKFAQPIVDDIGTALATLHKQLPNKDQELVRKYVLQSVKQLGFSQVCTF